MNTPANDLASSAELQDHLMSVSTDLEHLGAMLDDACATLLTGFLGVTEELKRLQVVKPENSAAIGRAIEHLGDTARALQFQDMSSQLITHANQRLRHCADRLAQQAFAGHEDEDEDGPPVITPAPSRPNPVTQSEMDTGFVELF
jgi:hypothetical protein